MKGFENKLFVFDYFDGREVFFHTINTLNGELADISILDSLVADLWAFERVDVVFVEHADILP